jgi:regulator of sirC expression with transglutaminase-like and TPR domain
LVAARLDLKRKARTALGRYLALAPTASDARQVARRIGELEQH